MRTIVLTLVAILFVAAHAAAAPVGTSFSYQGQLIKSGSPYQGNADGTFRLFNDPNAGSQVGSTITVTSMAVTGGLFTTELDFGSVFTGTALWLDVQVRTPPDPGFTALTPRIRLSGSPFAMYALNAPPTSSQWLNDPFGIHYTAGNVGLGVLGQDSHGGVKLYINTGTQDLNPLWVLSDNANFAAFQTKNAAVNGMGWYDDTSDRHYVGGRLGMSTLTPACNIHSLGVEAIRGESSGGGSPGMVPAGIRGIGRGSQFIGFAPGVIGEATGVNGVEGYTDASSAAGGYFKNRAGGAALFADGVAKVKTLQILGGADLAEPFGVAGDDRSAPDAGTVVVIDPAKPGELRVSDAAYDTRVAGIISGGRGLAPGMVMRAEGDEYADGAHPVALTGRVWCKVDATSGAVHPGDLLTTSAMPGHAMKANDAARRAGAVIGKAMTSLEAGRGLVLVLVSLQ